MGSALPLDGYFTAERGTVGGSAIVMVVEARRTHEAGSRPGRRLDHE